MKKLFLMWVSFLTISALAQDKKVINDANAVQRNLSGHFNAISVSDGIDLYITQANEESIAVSASDKQHIDRLKTEVVNGTLKIYYDRKGITWRSGNRNLRAYVSFKSIEKLAVAGGSHVKVNESINAGMLTLNVSSGSGFKGTVNAKEVKADVSSGAGIKISGKADKLTVNASSGGDFKGFNFATDFCDASASSGSGVQVTINKELNAAASSGADIHYKGSALIRDIKTSSGGSVKKG